MLLDLNIPRKNGEEVPEEFHEDPNCRRIPVIVLTGSEAKTDVVKSYKLCVNGYLTKPVDPTSLSNGTGVRAVLALDNAVSG